MKRAFVLISLGLLGLPAAGLAQGQQCDIRQDRQWNIFGQGTPNRADYIGGDVRVSCPDGREFRADSMILLAMGEQRLLIGHAYVSDPEKTLSANTINYYGGQGHMVAVGGIVLTDKVNGAVITGGSMDYYPAKGSAQSHGTIFGNSADGKRPHALLKRKPAAAPRDTTAAPAAAAATPTPPAAPTPADTASTLVDGDRFEIQGQKVFHAYGNVVLTRLDMKGTAPEMLYDPDADHVRLMGGANVAGQDFTLAGGVIDGTLAGNQFKDVTATFRAVLTSKDLRVNAPSLTVSFANGEVQGMVALSAARAKRTATDGDVLAEAVAKEFLLRADSINAMEPAQKLDRVVAVGHAYGERQNDSLDVKNLPEIAKKDWLRGDTITGFFADAKPAPPAKGNSRNNRGQQRAAPAKTATADTTQRVLEKIVAVGAATQASSIYRIADDKKPKATPQVSYLVAKTITVSFKDGQVSLVTADGQIRGLHLQPVEKPKPKEKPTTGRKVAQGAAAQAGTGAPAASNPTAGRARP